MAEYKFTDVPNPSIEVPDYPYGQQSFDNLKSFKAGRGATSMGMNEQGFWVGADKFATAPFRVDMAGNAVITGIDTSNVHYGKTSFADSVNAGYSISTSGVYFGSANDTTYIKYAIATGTFVVQGQLVTGT
jgi:hypothetical protein